MPGKAALRKSEEVSTADLPERRSMKTNGQKIEKEVYCYCVKIAKSYYDLIEERRQIEKEILYGSSGPSDGMPRGSGTGDPTAAKAERLMQEKARVDKQLSAIQRAFDRLEDKWEQMLIRDNLFRHPWVSMECLIARGCPMSVPTMKRIRHDFIVDVARELGMI